MSAIWLCHVLRVSNLLSANFMCLAREQTVLRLTLVRLQPWELTAFREGMKIFVRVCSIINGFRETPVSQYAEIEERR